MARKPLWFVAGEVERIEAAVKRNLELIVARGTPEIPAIRHALRTLKSGGLSETPEVRVMIAWLERRLSDRLRERAVPQTRSNTLTTDPERK